MFFIVSILLIVACGIAIWIAHKNHNHKATNQLGGLMALLILLLVFGGMVSSSPSSPSLPSKDGRLNFHVNGREVVYSKDEGGADFKSQLGPYISGQVYNSQGMYTYHINVPKGSKAQLNSTDGDKAHISFHKIDKTRYLLTVKRNGRNDNDDDMTVSVGESGYKKNNLDLTVGTKDQIKKEDQQASQNDDEAEHESDTSDLENSIKSHVSDKTDDSVSLDGQFDAKPYTANVIIKDNMYDKPSVDYTTVLEALHGLQKCNLKDFQNIKITLETKADDSYGHDIGYIPVDWYNFNVSDISKMNTNNMSQADLDSIATGHGSKPIKTGL